MAKFAVIFVLFALCAVAMSARIAREEPAKPDLFDFLKQEGDKIAALFKENTTPEKLQEIKNKVESFTADASKKFQDGSADTLEAIQKAAAKLNDEFQKIKPAPSA
nr:uncharacterized protein LOC108062337 [Drosophila takahashii]